MDNKLNIINGKIIQQYLINRNMSETEFDEFITGDGFFEGIGDLDISYNYDQLISSAIKLLNTNSYDLEIIQTLLISCAIDEETGYALDAILTEMNRPALYNLIICGIFHSWPRIRCCFYQNIKDIDVINCNIILYNLLLDEQNAYALRIGLIALSELNLFLAKKIAFKHENHLDPYLRNICIELSNRQF